MGYMIILAKNKNKIIFFIITIIIIGLISFIILFSLTILRAANFEEMIYTVRLIGVYQQEEFYLELEKQNDGFVQYKNFTVKLHIPEGQKYELYLEKYRDNLFVIKSNNHFIVYISWKKEKLFRLEQYELDYGETYTIKMMDKPDTSLIGEYKNPIPFLL